MICLLTGEATEDPFQDVSMEEIPLPRDSSNPPQRHKVLKHVLSLQAKQLKTLSKTFQWKRNPATPKPRRRRSSETRVMNLKSTHSWLRRTHLKG